MELIPKAPANGFGARVPAIPRKIRSVIAGFYRLLTDREAHSGSLI